MIGRAAGRPAAARMACDQAAASLAILLDEDRPGGADSIIGLNRFGSAANIGATRGRPDSQDGLDHAPSQQRRSHLAPAFALAFLMSWKRS
jgi:hypothetical protein